MNQMRIRMNQQFPKLPDFIIQEILSFHGYDIIRYRIGRWMNRISKNDNRKFLLQKLVRPQLQISNSSWSSFSNNRLAYSVKLGKKNGIYRYHLHFHPDKIIVYTCYRIKCELTSTTLRR